MTSATGIDSTFQGSAVQPSMNFQLMEKMNSRTEMYAADLYVLLQREFRRRQAPECSMCYVQLPFRVDRRDAQSSNWEVVLPPPCASGCQEAMLEIIDDFQSLYDLREESEDRTS
jgi:hypothetical protein